MKRDIVSNKDHSALYIIYKWNKERFQYWMNEQMLLRKRMSHYISHGMGDVIEDMYHKSNQISVVLRIIADELRANKKLLRKLS